MRTLLGRVVRVFHHPKLLAVGVKLVDQVGGDLDLPAIDVVLPRVRRSRARPSSVTRTDVVFILGLLLLPGSTSVSSPVGPLVIHVLSVIDGRIAVEIGIGKEAGAIAGVVEDVEEDTCRSRPGTRVPRPMICLNSTIELTTRARTMFLQVGASTPVVSICDVVRMTGSCSSPRPENCSGGPARCRPRRK